MKGTEGKGRREKRSKCRLAKVAGAEPPGQMDGNCSWLCLGALLELEMSKKCTPMLPKAAFEVEQKAQEAEKAKAEKAEKAEKAQINNSSSSSSNSNSKSNSSNENKSNSKSYN